MRFKSGNKTTTQSGFTVIELVIYIAIAGILGAAIVMSITQLFQGNSSSNNYNTARNNARSAGDWITRDVRMADTITPSSGFPFTLTWTNYGGTPTHTVVYAYSVNDKTITRQYDGGALVVIAKNISSVTQTNDGKTLTLTVNVEAGTGLQKKTIMSTYEISLRNG